MMETTDMCRTCLKQSFEMLHLFSKVLLDEPAIIKDILMDITTIQVAKADGLPEMICSQCLEELKRAFSFKKMCETSDSTLRCNTAPQKEQNPLRTEPEIDFVNIKPEPETETELLNVKPETNLDMEIENTILDIKSEYENPSSNEPVHYTDDENQESDVQDSASALLIPCQSKERYEKQYTIFCDWRKAKGQIGANQELILAFLGEQSERYKPSSLWASYSMLKKTLISYENVNIGNFSKVSSFLKSKSVGYVPKKSAYLSREEVERFLKEAPNEEFLLVKVVTIFGVYGGCRRQELCDLKLTNVKDEGAVVIVRLPDQKTHVSRAFSIFPDGDGFNPIDLLRRYIKLRPKHVKNDRLFLSYRKKKCTVQPVGVKTIGRYPSLIAKYLGLKDAASYSGHCYRRTSAKFVAIGKMLSKESNPH